MRIRRVGEGKMMLEGGCYCGALRYRAEGDPIFQAQCHCRECQYITGGNPNAFIGMPEAGFTYTKGSPRQFKRSDIENPVTREFCENCGTAIGSRAPTAPGVMILKVGTLDDPSVFEQQMAIYTIGKQAFHHIADGVAQFERLPG